MAVKVVVGSQWGDEGKAKIVDYLTEEADIVVRFQGGANAGHTVVIGQEKFIFHLIPTGIIHPDKICVIGNGVVLDPAILLEEKENLRRKGITVEGRLLISQNAHLVMPYHKLLDRAKEESKAERKIGTTGRGIGPCYADKAARVGIRAADLLDEGLFREKLIQNIREKNEILAKIYGWETIDGEKVFREYRRFSERLRPFITDTSVFLHQAIKQGRSVLFEGAQGTLLDMDQGTYPFVTSSNTIAGSACTGSGIGPTQIDEVIGVAKAYASRVGNGPFPTELKDAAGERIRELGQEYGATTGRPRRCGWFDAVVVRLASRVNGLTSLAVTRLDVLDSFPTINICTAYRYKGEVIEDMPADPKSLSQCEPVYETWNGWMCPTSETRSLKQLPEAARAYLQRIAELTQTRISIVSVGPSREQTIQL
ncbi:MAG: adenylosuccinate synthase [Candidatus Latescibacterota bacterium]|nr:MAG: adenylosuccinate synthase [Candidatus Latescibacterota bacterium]